MWCENGVPAATWFDTYDHIGSNYPYYLRRQPTHFHTRIAAVIQEVAVSDRRIDPVGALGFLTKGYLPGNRTMLQGVRKAPWMGTPDGLGGWHYAQVPRHGSATRPAEEVAADLRAALYREMLGYVSGRRRMGILLSGGLDSRIAAGILRETQETGDFPGAVTAVTWGVDGCRDVTYAAEIARRYGWDWVHIPLGPEQVWDNIRIGAEMGAEFAPFHLHAMQQVNRLEGIDAFVAGSYGDSVGRAEFSGSRVWELKPTLGWRFDKFGMLRTSVRNAAAAELQKTIYSYRVHVRDRSEGQYREIEQQMHYMRRRNQGPLALIAAHVPLFQLFTAPATCSVMWAQEFRQRGDQHYAQLLPTLPGRVGDLPWARNGVPLGAQGATPDEYAKMSHKYGQWLRNELGTWMLSLLKSDALHELNLFNPVSLAWLARIWPQATTRSVSMLDETVAWLGALALFAEQYQLQGVHEEDRQIQDVWDSTCGYLYASVYQKARQHLRV